jgi:predicted DNA-binding transcriptional regulator AlpA
MYTKSTKVGKPKPNPLTLPELHEQEKPERAAPRVKLISRKQMLARIGDVSYPTIWKLMKRGLFPRPRLFGRRAFWVEAEVDGYLANLPAAPLTIRGVIAPPAPHRRRRSGGNQARTNDEMGAPQ